MVFSKTFTQKRWDRARGFQKFHEEKTGEKLGLKEFYKSDNEVTKEIFKYEVTFEMYYRGEGYEFFIPQESFVIYGFGAITSEDELRSKVKQGVGQNFKGGAQSWLYDNTEVKVRGVEKMSTRYKDIDLNQLQNNNVYADKIPSFEVGKRSNKSSANMNKYGLNIWL